eukprot:EG_transcript_33365
MFASAVEWYDFSAFAAMEPWITANFFPGSPTSTWLTFGVSFVARPLGGLAIGMVADRAGRRVAALGALAVMYSATVGQGLTPRVAGLGPAWLVACRVVQGFATAGAFGSSCVLLSESANGAALPAARR